ncbi:MAG: ribonuclease R, partial [Chitinophagia bacterium]|nr:ribonuclease R [Chitinophagia bacterium]
DIVKVELHGSADSGRRLEGQIVGVVSRKQNEFTGTVEVLQHFAFLIPDSSKVGIDIYIPLHLLNDAKNGDKAIARIVEWTPKTKNPIGEIVRVLTYESQNEIAMQGILNENGFPLHFPDEVLEEAARYPDVIAAAEVKRRRDFRDVLTFTIDPVDARDFDDALSFKVLKGGWYEVGVHIADVGHFIEAGSPLDLEAYQRATSVYLPDRVLPMLPERLSNQLCSLRPYEDKYTFSAVFKINKQGKVTETWLGKTLIHSNRRFTYEDVQEIIEGAEGDHKKELLILNEMAQSLRKKRFQNGAINFSSQEVRFKLDEEAKPIGIIVKESKDAHKLIEEFMLLANRSVAEYVSQYKVEGKEVPFPYRVHDNPDPDKLAVFASFARRFGVRLDIADPDGVARSFNDMLDSVKGKPEQHVLEQLGIRTMAKAIYTTSNYGHYGLGFNDYCHFTSPIRRYPDVLVHRILLQCLDNKVKPIKNLEAMCKHCSEQERRAMDSERAANKYKQVEYMKGYLGEEFEAVISGVAAFGFWAETVAHKCEGMVSAAYLDQIDQFVFIEEEYALVGRRSGLKFAMGDKVTVKVIAANLDKRQIDYELANLQVPTTHIKKKKGAPEKKSRRKK